MKLRYTVHSANPETVLEEATTAAGRLVNAPVPALIVEMVTDDEIHGHTFRLKSETDEHMAEMVALFRPGAAVDVTFAAAASVAAVKIEEGAAT